MEKRHLAYEAALQLLGKRRGCYATVEAGKVVTHGPGAAQLPKPDAAEIEQAKTDPRFADVVAKRVRRELRLRAEYALMKHFEGTDLSPYLMNPQQPQTVYRRLRLDLGRESASFAAGGRWKGPAPTDAELKALMFTAEADEYVHVATVHRFRRPRYPTRDEQVEALMKGGQDLTDMQARVQAVKDDYPKPAGTVFEFAGGQIRRTS